MKKHIALVLAGLFVAATVAAVTTAGAAEYDRYERGDRYRDRGEEMPPPRRGAEVPPPRHAQYGQPYFFLRAGVFEPNDDTRNQTSGGLRDYSSGGDFELGVGSRVSPVFAVDGTVGAYRATHGGDHATVIPVTIGARLILPHPFIEPYVGGGVGLYSTSLKDAYRAIDGSATDFGGYLSVGVDFWLNPRVALDFEGKYHWVTSNFSSNLGSDDVNLGGWTMNLGVRFGF